jgi:hypothetical protein
MAWPLALAEALIGYGAESGLALGCVGRISVGLSTLTLQLCSDPLADPLAGHGAHVEGWGAGFAQGWQAHALPSAFDLSPERAV